MSRTPATLSSDIRLSDFVSLGNLAKVYPKSAIRAALRKTGREGERERELPDFITVYYILMLSFFPTAAYKEVLRVLLDGLQWLLGPHVAKVTVTSAVTQARQRIGPEPLKELYDRIVKPIATDKTRGARYRRWTVHALDGTLVDVPDTKANRDFFGKASNQNQADAGYPKLRAVSLVECGTHAIHGTELGWLKKRVEQEEEQPRKGKAGSKNSEDDRHSERYLASLLLAKFSEGMLVLADRGFFSFSLWCRAAETGAALCWRIKDDVHVEIEKRLPDGSNLCVIKRGVKEVQVRLIEYEIEGSTDVIRLLTNVLEHGDARAKELALLYHERWEIETTYRELKKHLNLSRITLRSKTPELVQQEFWGLLLVHYAVRGVMHEAALEADEDPDRISFTHSLNVIRRHLPRFGSFPPSIDSRSNH